MVNVNNAILNVKRVKLLQAIVQDVNQEAIELFKFLFVDANKAFTNSKIQWTVENVLLNVNNAKLLLKIALNVRIQIYFLLFVPNQMLDFFRLLVQMKM